MGAFLSPTALKVIAEDYQNGLLERLKEETKGTRLTRLKLHSLLSFTSPLARFEPLFMHNFFHTSRTMVNRISILY